MKISDYINAELSIIPCKEDKKPLGQWKEFQSRVISLEEAKTAFFQAKKIGLVCGAVSGNLECIDVDLKYDNTGDLYQRLCAVVPADILSLFVIQTTVSGGYHWWYKCDVIEGNLKLATGDDNNVLIETRGEGGFAIVAPSAGYSVIQGSFSDIKTITPQQRETVLNICKSFDLRKQTATILKPKPTAAPTDTDTVTPWDDFNNQHSPLDVLTGYGWTVIKQTHAHIEVGRPNDSEKKKSGIVTDNVAYIHSTSTPLPTDTKLTPFAIYAWYEHGGDIKKAAADLNKKGYGTAIKPKKKDEPYKVPEKPKSNIELQKPAENNEFIGGWFKPLGYNKNGEGVQNFYFYSKACKSLIGLTANKMTYNNLFMIAPLDYWVLAFYTAKPFDLKAASNWLIELCNSKGYFTEDVLRGRGAWLDGEDIVLHSGNYLIVNGQKKSFSDYNTDYIYEVNKPMKLSIDNPLSSDEASKIFGLFTKLNWANPIYPFFLTGWLAIAPLTGVLKWRPHLWITGAAGSGKSWVFGIVAKMIKNISINAQADSSAAGIRQALMNDALNIIFDEAEGNTEADMERMENVMSLMRAASSGNSAPILKGSQSGAAKEFFVRSCFAFSSINPQFDKSSDTRRITLLELLYNPDTKGFKPIEQAFKELLTEDYIYNFQARMIVNIHSVLKSIDIFIEKVTFLTGSRAIGDQLGTILGGWWHVMNDSAVTDAQALEILNDVFKNYDISAKESEDTKDELACLQVILSKQERAENDGIPTQKTVGELVEIASSLPTPLNFKQDNAQDCILRLGLKVMTYNGIEYLAILNKSVWVKMTLRGTPWVKSYSKVLKRINGAISHNARFSSGIRGGCIMIPIAEIFKDYTPVSVMQEEIF
jgi:hypothetical protein